MPLAAASMDPRRLAEALRRVGAQGAHALPPQSSDNYERMNDLERRRNEIERRRGLARALMQPQAPQGQMVGRFYVPPNPLQHVAALGSQFLGHRANRRLDQEQQQADKDEGARLTETMRSNGGAQTLDPAALANYERLPLDVRRQIATSRIASQFAPPQQPEGFTLSPGQTRYQGDQLIASMPAAGPTQTDDEREYERAKGEGYDGSFHDFLLENRRAGASSTNLAVNTERSLYGTLAENRAKSISELYDLAQKAPDLLQRAQLVKSLVGPDSQALTGMGANWMLGAAKVANQLGINTGDAAADTEMLATQLAASTLDSIKSSGLGGGTGFSNADRDFLERVVGGKITLEARTIAQLADLNERAALGTMQRWNETASRLDPQQLRGLGLAPIEMPRGTPAPGAQPKLQQNPDGSYTYTP